MNIATRKVLLILVLLGVLHTAYADLTCTWLCSLAEGSDATLVQNSNGVLYGTTLGDGVGTSCGSVFDVWPYLPNIEFGVIYPPIFTNLLVFQPDARGGPDFGSIPDAGVVLGSNGCVFGTTSINGTSNTLFNAGIGSIYGLFPNSGMVGVAATNFTIRIYRFGSITNSQHQPLDGASPRSTFAMASNNYAYGTAFEGGSNGYSSNGLGCGTVYKLNATGTNFAVTGLHSFAGSDGANPTGLTFGSDGYLYGVTSFGGSNTTVVETNGKTGFGVIYKITTNGAFTMFYSFGTITNATGDALDGSQPNPLLQGSDGNFYGTTVYGGLNTIVVNSNRDIGYGTFFRVSTNGVFTSLYSFGAVTNAAGVPLDGANPSGPLVQGLDGNFYGTTQFGGTTNTGTVFRITPQGILTTIHAFGTYQSFNRIPVSLLNQSGEFPRGGLLIGLDDNFYGTTFAGGGGGFDSEGAIFRLGPAAPTFTSALASITIPAGATNLYSGAACSLYPVSCYWLFNGTNLIDGSMISGSTTSNLTVNAVTAANAGTYTQIASNIAGSASASGVLTVVPAIVTAQPIGSTIPAGATYIFTVGVNTVYPITYQWQMNGTNLLDGGEFSGSASNVLTISGAMPGDSGAYSVVVSNSAGQVISGIGVLNVVPFLTVSSPTNLSIIAGSTASFSLALQNDEPVTYQWQFNGGNLVDGGNVSGSSTSNLTLANATLNDAGVYTIIASDAAGNRTNSATLTVVPFVISSLPSSATIMAGSNVAFNISINSAYPMTYQWQYNGTNLSDSGNVSGSTSSNLILIALTTANTGTYSVIAGNLAASTNLTAFLTVLNATAAGCGLNTLYSFTGNNDGANPNTTLVQGSDGNFYGTTRLGYGSVFRVSSSGFFSNLYSFGQLPYDDAIIPVSSLIQATDGNFYGTTSAGGGDFDNGAVYRITPSGAETILFVISNTIDSLQAGVVQDPSGAFYGGDTEGNIFQLTTGGTYSPVGSIPGNQGLSATMIFGSDGNLYGVTSGGGSFLDGSVFQASTNGFMQTLYSFAGAGDGANPQASLLQGRDGAFYGATSARGVNGSGTLFRLTTNGSLTTMYAFGTVTNWDGSALDGSTPNELLLASDGNYYGTTYDGGYESLGTVFRLTPGGILTTLVYFDGSNGANPEAALIEGMDGAFYGTAVNGGINGLGIVFRLTVNPVLQAMSQSNGMISLSCSAVSGETYQVQYCATLNPAVWQNMGDPILASSNNVIFTDGPTSAQKFYRVIQLLSQ